MFIDETVIEVRAGDGGNGCYAHAREKYKPRGRPSGGGGGRGGHVFFEGSGQLHTLRDMAYQRVYRAGRGQHGKGSNKDGKNGEDVTVRLPLGTLVYDEKSGRQLHDCLEDGAAVRIARGGRGGKGNAALVTRRNPNPERAQAGRSGEVRRLRLVLKVLADIGLVGRPNAGKSTLLSRISSARPKIADYPFTTKEPHLGIVSLHEGYESFVVADIPGLIEGAHLGKGLGHRFLRHIERTRALAIMVDAASEEPDTDATALLEELRQYSPVLAEKPACFLLSKCDTVSKAALQKPREREWQPISAVAGTNIRKAIAVMYGMLKQERRDSGMK